MNYKALIIEDEPNGKKGTEKRLNSISNIEIINKTELIDTADSAIEWINKKQPDILFLDIELGNSTSGFDVIKYLTKIKHNIIVFVVTAFTDKEDYINGIIDNHIDLKLALLPKPLDKKEVISRLSFYEKLNSKNTLILAKDYDDWEDIAKRIEHENINIVHNKVVKDAAEGVILVNKYYPDVLIFLLKEDDLDFLKILNSIRKKGISPKVIFISNSPNHKKHIVQYGEFNYLYLEFPLDDLELVDFIEEQNKGSQNSLEIIPPINSGNPKTEVTTSIRSFLTYVKNYFGDLTNSLREIKESISLLKPKVSKEGFTLSKQKEFVYIRFKDLIYCEVAEHQTRLYLVNYATGNKYVEVYPKRLTKLIEEVDFPKNFCSIKKSTFVNLNFLDRVGSSKNRKMSLQLPSGLKEELEISANNYSYVISYIKKYM